MIKLTKKAYVVMKAVSFGHLQTGAGGPQWFLPVFDTRKQAVKWDGGNSKLVREIEPVTIERQT